jgi:hypothetical protein
MYDFYYNTLLSWSEKRGANVRLAYTDTDSLIFSADIPDWTTELLRPDCTLKNFIDFSNLDPTHPLYNDEHKGELGYLKEETKFDKITDFIALQPKTYVLLTESLREKKSAKGVRYCKHREIMHRQYRQVLNHEKEISVTSSNIQRINLCKLVTRKETKTALSLYENKRYWLDHKTSVAYGHWSIVNRVSLSNRTELMPLLLLTSPPLSPSSPPPSLPMTPQPPPSPRPQSKRSIEELLVEMEERIVKRLKNDRDKTATAINGKN